MKEPHWVDVRALILLHAESLTEHGGLWGLRDEAALESSLARPRHLYTYQRKAEIAALAASYGYALIRNHPFNDGNKRVGFLVIGLLLSLNGLRLEVDPIESVQIIMGVAENQIGEKALTEWIRHNLVREKSASLGVRAG
jgi:death on curing protein